MGSKEVNFYRGETRGYFTQNLFFRENVLWVLRRLPKNDGKQHSYKKKTEQVGCMVIDQSNPSAAQIHVKGKVAITKRDGKPIKIEIKSAQTLTAKQVSDTKDTYTTLVPPPSFLNAMTRIYNRTKTSGLHSERIQLRIVEGRNKVSITKTFEGSVSPGEALNETGTLTKVNRSAVPEEIQKKCDKLAK